MTSTIQHTQRTRSAALALLACASAFGVAAPAVADDFKLPPISLGAGVRASFNAITKDGPTPNAKDFNLESVRIYMTGSVLPSVKLTVNTEYGADNKLIVMDAIARFEAMPEFNIWAGRFLPPSDRANLYGPYYSNHWGVYRDGVQDNYNQIAVGRDNGIAYWGDFGNLKLSAGAFDTPTTSNGSAKDNRVIAAGRIQYDFWDQEPGYFLNSTYYGEKNLLALGAAAQTAAGDTTYSIDLLVEKNVKDVGVFTLESEYMHGKGITQFSGTGESKGAYGLASYLFPQKLGPGKVQLLGKYAEASTVVAGPNPKLKTTEFNVGYIVKDFNLRGYLFVIRQYGDIPVNSSAAGLGLQIQM